MVLKAWTDICRPKNDGGLDFRRFYDMNLALLSKLDWKLAEGEDVLWANLLRTIYIKGQSLFEYKLKKGNSFVW